MNVRNLWISIIFILFMSLTGCTFNKTEPHLTSDSIPNSTNTTQIINATITQNEPTQSNITIDFKKIRDEKNNDKPIVHYFYSPSCPACKNISAEMENIKSEFKSEIVLYEYDMSTYNATIAHEIYSEQFRLNPKIITVPEVIVNGTILTGVPQIRSDLRHIINILINKTS